MAFAETNAKHDKTSGASSCRLVGYSFDSVVARARPQPARPRRCWTSMKRHITLHCTFRCTFRFTFPFSTHFPPACTPLFPTLLPPS